MKLCYTSCGISLMFIVGMIYMTLNVDKQYITDNFLSILNEKQREIYKNIVNERRNIYYSGYVLGLLISLLLISFLYYNNVKLSKINMICLIMSISFVSSYFFYILSPKKNHMILHLTNEKQREEWLNVYRYMQYNYHMGLFLGLLANVFIGNSICY